MAWIYPYKYQQLLPISLISTATTTSSSLTMARLSFLAAFFVVLLMSSSQAQSLVQKKISSRLLLRELGYDRNKLEHYRQVFALKADSDRVSPGGPDHEHHAHPPRMP
ncbi:hypothetical protein Goshw_011706 [Gossypium schwendimanii]|uniref:Uncharacterized protein n=2 Tax=Gossypium TaxID=3633 RepID=A0A7J9LFP7_GOSSC|nr:hypothetical protein [Gossypium lobatum]MBA0857386.1 hypothetical protein [Gossypium schwendimanii]